MNRKMLIELSEWYQYLKAMREEFLSDSSKGKVSVMDDGYNVVICKKSNNMPLYAICYGEVE